MLQHNLKLTIRGYLRYKSAFLINLLGLASGLACTLLIYLWVNDELQVNQFHEKSDRLYQILSNSTTSSGVLTDRATPGRLAAAMADELPEVELAVTKTWTNTYTLSHEETNLKAVGQYVGKDYFKVFSFELLQGDRDKVLEQKRNILISDDLAIKLFGNTTDVVGKTIRFQQFRDYQVSGVFKKPPPSSTQQFDFLMTYEEFEELNSWVLNWKNNGPSTFVVLAEGIKLDEFNNKIKDFVRDHNGEENITPIATLYADLYLHGKYENGSSVGGRISNVRLFTLIALFILGIACINFMNLATAKVSRRMKEIGIKKTIGASRQSLAGQFLSESLLMTVLSLALALLVAWLVLPEFNHITGKQLSISFSTQFALILLSILFLTGLLAGSYPAVYLSAIKPIKVLKSQASNSLRELWLRKGLVVFQFSISIILIVSVLVVNNQIQYTQEKDIGFNKDNILYLEAEGQIELNMEAFITEVKKIPGIAMASSTAHSFVEGGYTGWRYDVDWEGKDPEASYGMEYLRVNYDMIELLEFEIASGRSFSRDFKTDYNKVIFNEKAISLMNLDQPIGSTVNIGGQDTQIVGVVKDFHFRTFHEEVGPAYFVLQPDDTWLIMVRLQQGLERETISQLGELYAQFNPDFNFDYKFLDQDYEAQYVAEQRVATLSKYFSFIAILISCLGLLGLASFSTERRIKEIGVRKALGSSRFAIVQLISGEFTKIVLAAVVLSLPISYFVTKSWLNGFAYRIELSWWFFLLAGVSALLIAWLTVGFQTVKASMVNPAQCLRNE
ncbi:transporter permease [Roseivirga sp. 4D4]|nr:transporter permease [Roseivirga sp. 4D4]